MISAVEAVPTAISNSEVLSISVEKERDRPATLRHRAHEPRALSSIVTRTEAKTDAIVDVLPFLPGPPSFVREHHQLGLHLHVDRSNRHACFLPAPRKVTFWIEQSLPLPLSDVYAPTGFNEVFPALRRLEKANEAELERLKALGIL